MDSILTINISEESIKRVRLRTQILVTILSILFIFMAAFILSSSAGGLRSSIGWALFGMFMFTVGLTWATSAFIRGVMEDMSISLYGDAIERRSGRHAEPLQFNTIKKIELTYNA